MKHLAIKVTNKYESEAVQKELISLGYRWLSNDDNTFDLSSNLPVVILCTPLSVLAWRNFSLDMMKEDIVIISSSDFFSTYAGHIERFPDYVVNKKYTFECQFNVISCLRCLKYGKCLEIHNYIAPTIDPKTGYFTKEECNKVDYNLWEKECLQFLDKYFPKDKKPTTLGAFTPGLYEKQQPKFKVGDYLYYVMDCSIDKYIISEIKENRNITVFHLNIRDRSTTINEEWIHCEYIKQLDYIKGSWHSTPELATKRFLELNAEKEDA